MQAYLVHIIASTGEYEKVVSNLVVANNREDACLAAIKVEAHNELELVEHGVYAENDCSFTYSVRGIYEVEPQDIATLHKYGIY